MPTNTEAAKDNAMKLSVNVLIAYCGKDSGEKKLAECAEFPALARIIRDAERFAPKPEEVIAEFEASNGSAYAVRFSNNSVRDLYASELARYPKILKQFEKKKKLAESEQNVSLR